MELGDGGSRMLSLFYKCKVPIGPLVKKDYQYSEPLSLEISLNQNLESPRQVEAFYGKRMQRHLETYKASMCTLIRYNSADSPMLSSCSL